jgi:multisubunit Na+/H+ antiporter MnhB subunit
VLSSFSALGVVLLAFSLWWHMWFAPGGTDK